MQQPVLQIKNLSKSFGKNHVLEDISLTVRAGSVLGLMGENGAGKSTMMKCLFGIYRKDEGQIFNHLNMQIQPQTIMRTMSVSQRQMAEIAKAVSYNAKIIVLDEPTSSLTEPEVQKLFSIINDLKKQGVSFIYISHKMDEIFKICDEIAVLRDGSLVMQKPTDETDMDELITAMVGRSLEKRFPDVDNEPGDYCFEVSHLSTKYAPILDDISFKVREGEIFGIYGLVGAGRSELLEALFGIRTISSGTIAYKGTRLFFESAQDAIAHGFALVSEERKFNGMFGKGSITFNTVIANLENYYQPRFILSEKQMEHAAKRQIRQMHTKCVSPDESISALSGGNQQKVIIGRWLEGLPTVLLLDEPTRGIDVSAKFEIYELIVSMAKKGTTIILVSSEMPELLGITNRIAVMSNHQLAGIVETKETTQEELRVAEYTRKSLLFDAKNKFIATVEKAKAVKEQCHIDYVQKNREIRNGKASLWENMQLSLQHFVSTFQLSRFFLNNGLYLSVLVFFVICVVIAPLTGNGNLLSLPNIFTILELSSVRMFYALGIAGLILLAGTDLSVGRMAALGAVLSGLILHPGRNIVTLFGMGPWDFSALPAGLRILFALFLSIFFCVIFSSFSGFFSAKLKIHPFISTLATQLIIYGLLFVGTGGTPVGTIDAGIKDLIGGRWILGSIGGEVITFPKLIVPAVIAIAVAWFIWNKTVFGKNMYAVGGNPEAANVSGINVFRVTMGVFIMAGVFYGLGAFFEIFKANANAGTGQGYELDAIAACVIGGISFSGGVGKISGAVAGVITFTGLTYCLTFLGIDTNLQFVFKGVIIIAAVALDSIKNLRHK